MAGIIDSDGSISLSKVNKKRKNPSYFTLIQLTWIANDKNLAVLEKIKTEFGGNVYKIARKPTSFNSKYKHTYKWMINNHNAIPFLERVKPFLLLKKEQAQICIDFHNEIQKNKYSRTNKIPKEEFERRDKIHEQMKSLNSKNSEGTYVPYSI